MKTSIPLDRDKLIERIGDIKRSLAKLNRYREFTPKDFEENEDQFALALHWLRIGLEAVLVIGTHILSRLPSNGRKKDYTQILISLGEYGVLPKEFAQKIRGMAGYRNRLVHLYWEVTPQEVSGILRQDIEDFEQFVAHIEKFIEKHTKA